MSKTVKIMAIIFVAILFTACNKNKIYEKHKTNFPQFRWEKSNVVEFNPEIIDTTSNYKITVALRHVFGFNLKSIKIDLEIISPSGKNITNEYIVSFYDDEGDLLSLCAGDICDMEQLIEDDFSFNETGTYEINIYHLMNINPLPNIMEVGLIIEKSVPALE